MTSSGARGLNFLELLTDGTLRYSACYFFHFLNVVILQTTSEFKLTLIDEFLIKTDCLSLIIVRLCFRSLELELSCKF